MKGGLLDYITNHAHFYQFRYRQLVSQLSSRWPELDRDDEMMMKCWDASGKLPLEALRLFPQRKNKQIHELNDVTFRKSAAATQQQKKIQQHYSVNSPPPLTGDMNENRACSRKTETKIT